jgi:hypothetical protein
MMGILNREQAPLIDEASQVCEDLILSRRDPTSARKAPTSLAIELSDQIVAV